MKKIALREKLIPYSPVPGVHFPYPSTSETLQFFPSCFVISHLEAGEYAVHFSFPSSAIKIQTFYHLFEERFEVQISFEEGIFHYHLLKIEEKWSLEVKRCTLEVSVKTPKKQSLKKGDVLLFPFGPAKKTAPIRKEVLLLGCHKKSQVEKIFERENFLEILPHLFALGQMRAANRLKTKLGPFSFFEEVLTLAEKKEHADLLNPLKELFRCFFSVGFVPHLDDIHHLGQTRTCKELKPHQSFDLLRRFYEVIRGFFFYRKQDELFFFPHLPSELPAGRGIEFKEKDFSFSFEWSKKVVKKIEFTFLKQSSYRLHFPKGIKICRVRVENESYSLKNGQLLSVEPNKTYLLDRFQK